jgi:hypothetical protein
VPQVFDKDIKDIRGSLKPSVVFDPTVIIVVAIHKDASRNRKVKIPCSHSIPLPGYTYTSINDTCLVHCCGHLNLGTIGLSYIVEMKGTAGWSQKIPMPVPVIRRYLEFEQRQQLRAFQACFKNEAADVEFEFLQMSSAY